VGSCASVAEAANQWLEEIKVSAENGFPIFSMNIESDFFFIILRFYFYHI